MQVLLDASQCDQARVALSEEKDRETLEMLLTRLRKTQCLTSNGGRDVGS